MSENLISPEFIAHGELPKTPTEREFYSRDGRLVNFHSDRWRLNTDIELTIGAVCNNFPGDSMTLRYVVEFYAKHSSPSHAKNLLERLAHYVKSLNGAPLLSPESIISYSASLDKSRAWYLSSVRVILRQWVRMGYPGIPAETTKLLDNLTIKGNEKGRAVQSMCPEEGPLTDIEMLGVVEAATHSFANNDLGLEETCLLMTLAMTGRRPAQISALKIKDLISKDGKYWINFPRAKQRNAKWRSSFKRFAIVEDLWLLLSQQVGHVKNLFSNALGIEDIPLNMQPDLPLFPRIAERVDIGDLQSILQTDHTHIPSYEIYTIVRDAGQKIGVVSERTGEPVYLNPNRFRYTLGTNLAREGKGIYVIAEALDHSDTQNSGVYVKNVPDIVKRIDKAVAMQLAPLAQAFKGILITSEQHAKRGNDPSSRVTNGRSCLGNCGSYGFCGALAPVACYTCAHFQPWVDGPHEQVLEGLISERDRVAEQTGDLKIASTNDRLILAVGDVVRRCRIAKGEVSDV